MNHIYRLRFDQPLPADWDRLLNEFDDGSMYQTWEYGAVRWGVESLEHVRLLRGQDVVAMAQVVLRRLPLLGGGLAYLPWGPVWRKNGGDPDDLREALRALKAEYTGRRGYLLRVTPREIDLPENPTANIFAAEGFRSVVDGYRTLLVDLRQPFVDLEHHINRSWRRALKRAAMLQLSIVEGTGDDLYRVFKDIYHDMIHRKGFLPGVNIDEYERIQRALPDDMKMQIMIARMGERPVAALIASRIGNTGVGLLGATATDGLSSGAFHLLNMRMMRWLKAAGAYYYDFGGYDPEVHEGTSAFKSGLPGREVHFVGRLEASEHPLRTMIVHRAEQGRALARSVRSAAVTGRHTVSSMLSTERSPR